MDDIVKRTLEAEAQAAEIKAQAQAQAAEILSAAEMQAAEEVRLNEIDCAMERANGIEAARKAAEEEYLRSMSACAEKAKKYTDGLNDRLDPFVADIVRRVTK